MDYNKIKKIDEESLQQLTEGTGPTDSCLCSLLTPQDDRTSIKTTLKKAFGLGRDRKKTEKGNELTLTLSGAGGKGFKSNKEVVKRVNSCGKCGCDDSDLVLKHSEANIKIITPDISTLCPCSSNCLPGKEKLKNNIKVTIERVEIDQQLKAETDIDCNRQITTELSCDNLQEGSEDCQNM